MNSIPRRFIVSYLKNVARSAHAATTSEHEGKWSQLCKKLTFFIAIPAMSLGMINVFMSHRGHYHDRPPYVPYEYMCIRTKRFPWGDGQKTLLHNPLVNALPSGYEDSHREDH